jgi:hypothetical protein
MRVVGEIETMDLLDSIIGGSEGIDQVRIFELRPGCLLQERLELTTDESALVVEALHLREKNGLPFWTGLLCSASSLSRPPTRLLDQVLHHNRSDEGVCFLSASDIRSKGFQRCCQSYAKRPLALASRVRLRGGGTAHIPMLDFHCRATDTNLALAQEIAMRVGDGAGYLVGSGHSYHYFGTTLLGEDEFIAFLGRALLFAPAVDASWIGHQLIEGEAALRISPHPTTGKAPRVVAMVRP